jgi:hypothetical protein
MKNRRGRSMLLLALGLLVVAAQRPAQAQAGGGRIDGTWDITLTVRNCSTGAAIVTITELTTFHFGGTLTSSTAGLPQAAKTPGHGVWSHVSDQTYAYSLKFLRFDAAGAYIGWAVVRQQAVLDLTGDEYTAAGGIEFYNTAGGLVMAGCSTTSATRFQ